MNSVGLKQFRVIAASGAGSSTLLSYCVYDPRSRDAFLLDPHPAALDEYAEFISAHRLKPVFVLETQTHWSHPSAVQILKGRYCCTILGPFATETSLSLGACQFTIIPTPGISRDAVSISGHRLLFTGNTLWIGTSAPTGFPDSDAKAHYESLKKIVALGQGGEDRDLLILPAVDSNEFIFSTLAIEKKKNLALRQLASPSLYEEFIHWSRDRAIVPDETFRKIYEANSQGVDVDQRFSRLDSVFGTTGKLPEENGDFGLSIGSISPEKYALKLKDHAPSNVFLDVREREEYLAGHMPGAENIPWIEVGLHLPELRAGKRIYVSCLSGGRSRWATRTLSYLGFADVVNVSGGFSAWQNAGLPVEKGVQ